jgi:hypothetical protein
VKEMKLREQGESLEFKQRVPNMFTGKVPVITPIMHRHRWENELSSDVSVTVYAAIFNGLT